MSHFITLREAIDMTTAYRANHETILETEYKGQDILPLSETFPREAFDAVLDQEGCERIRIYFGMDSNLLVHAIVVGVDSQDIDMLPDGINGYKIIDSGLRCPADCPATSDLNT